MALRTAIKPGLAGAAPNLTAVAASDTFQNNGHMLYEVANASGGAITVTIDDPNSTGPASATSFNPDVVVSVPDGATRMIGPFPPNRFNDVNGLVTVTHSATTTVTAQLLDVS